MRLIENKKRLMNIYCDKNFPTLSYFKQFSLPKNLTIPKQTKSATKNLGFLTKKLVKLFQSILET